MKLTKTLLRLSLAAIASTSINLHASEIPSKEEIWKYVPTFGGTFRSFYRLSTATGQSRFEIANARLSASGYVMPWVNYFIQADFDNLGKFKMLDAYAIVKPTQNLHLYMGQMRVPLSSESSRIPANYHFCDVGLTSKFGNLRAVGVKAGYTMPFAKWYCEGGVFSAADMSNHTEWSSAVTYSIKTNYTVAGLKPEIGFMSRMPGDGGVRLNMFNASLSWTCGGFFAEAEYISRHYAHGAMKASHAYNVFASYAIPVRWKMADHVSFETRFDGLTGGSTGVPVATTEDGKPVLSRNIQPCNRLTAGATTSRKIDKLTFKFRINFEQYFYGHYDVTPTASDNNQLVTGVIVYF